MLRCILSNVVNDEELEKLNSIEEISLLLDFYHGLLSEKQREYLRLYHEDNLSLAEIADIYGVSRQGVFDGVRKAENALKSYEAQLKLVASYKEQSRVIARLTEQIDSVISSHSDDAELASQLKEVIASLGELDR